MTQTYTQREEYGLFETTPLCPLPPAATPQMHAIHGNEYDSPVFDPPFTMTMSHMYAHRGEYNLLETDPPPPTTTSHPYTDQDAHTLLEAMNPPKGATGLRTHLANAVAWWLRDELPGQFRNSSDDPAFLLLVAKLFQRSMSAQIAGNRYAHTGPETLEFQPGGGYIPVLSHPKPRHRPEGGTSVHDGPRMREVVRSVTANTDANIPKITVPKILPEPEPEQCLATMQRFRIGGADNGGSSNTTSDISQSRSRGKFCNHRRVGTYACRIPSCKRFGERLLYSRLRC
jgi:hypothetical protein